MHPVPFLCRSAVYIARVSGISDKCSLIMRQKENTPQYLCTDDNATDLPLTFIRPSTIIPYLDTLFYHFLFYSFPDTPIG